MSDNPVLLIVDDEPVNIQVLAACLKDHYTLKIATSGDQGLQLARTIDIDLILLDVEMPNMDGYEVCRTLKSEAETASIPIIFITGKDSEEEEEYGLQLGALDYITKPVRPAIVKARVETQITLKQQRDQLEKMALHDQLTGLYNRYYLLEEAKHKIAQAKRHQYDLSVLMIDIDHFKRVNDEHGHTLGDAVLKAVAATLNELSRTEDITARLGGEEFVLLLDNCDAFGAEAKAQKIRETIARLQPEGITVTVSIGVAQFDIDEGGFAEVLKKADIAMYQAKENGRNRVMLAGAERHCISLPSE